MFQSPVAPSADFAVDGAEAYGFPPFKGGKITALLQNSVEKYLDRRRQAGEGAGQDNVPGRIVSQGKDSQDAYGLVHEVKEGGGDITVAGVIFNFSKVGGGQFRGQ